MLPSTSASVGPVPSPSSGTNDTLIGVAASSATNAWAVGRVGTRVHRTVILHWNGSSWNGPRASTVSLPPA